MEQLYLLSCIAGGDWETRTSSVFLSFGREREIVRHVVAKKVVILLPLVETTQLLL